MGTIQNYFESQGKRVPVFLNSRYTVTFENASDEFFDATVSGASANYDKAAVAKLCAGVTEVVKRPAIALRPRIVSLVRGSTDKDPEPDAMFYFDKDAMAALLKSIKENITQTCEWVSKGANRPDCHVYTNGILSDLPVIVFPNNMKQFTGFNESGSPFIEISRDGVTFTLTQLDVRENG